MPTAGRDLPAMRQPARGGAAPALGRNRIHFDSCESHQG